MKKKIIVMASLILLLLVSVFMYADGPKNPWTTIPIRGKITWVYSEATNPIRVRWDYYTLDDNGNMVVKAPGAYPGAFNEGTYYEFYVEDYIIQTNEEFILPASVYNFYVNVSSERVRVEGKKIIISD